MVYRYFTVNTDTLRAQLHPRRGACAPLFMSTSGQRPVEAPEGWGLSASPASKPQGWGVTASLSHSGDQAHSSLNPVGKSCFADLEVGAQRS